ncbi:MAG: hypothetical protein ABI867_43250, partial [Kofleriaceae bacterium]
LVQLQAASGDQRSTRRELPAAAVTVTLALRATGSLGGAVAGPHSYVTRWIALWSLDDPYVHYDSTLAVGGDFTFDQLPAGDYDVTTPGSPSRRITIVAGRHTDLRLGSP